MEKILVAMDPERTSFCACIHALNLAKRINAKVFFLLVLKPRPQITTQGSGEEVEISVKKTLEAFIEEGRSEGVAVDYYLVYGHYERELTGFIQENKITLWVVGCPAEQAGPPETFNNFLDKIRHRINCRIEVVNKKQIISK